MLSRSVRKTWLPVMFENSNPQSIQRLISAPTGLQLTTPLNALTGSERTWSIQDADGLTVRYDYILPCGLLFSNITGSQVFRTDLLQQIRRRR